jgi:hypothetical protein
MINKNRKKVEVEIDYRDVGNWNYKDLSLPSVCTKPIAVIKIEGDEFVFSHEDLFRLLDAYLDVDVRSMDMILNPKEDTGTINSVETPFIQKVKQWVLENSKDVIKVEKQSRFNF